MQIAWTQKRQADNQEQVFGIASTLVERVQLFVERFKKVGDDIDRARASFDEARTSMSGNRGFVSSAMKLVEMGAKESTKRKKLTDEV